MKRRQAVKILAVINIVVALYILVIPFFPSLLYWIRQKTTEPPVIASQVVTETTDKPSFPKDNRLVIPSILLDEAVLEGPSSGTLHNGIWRRPSTSAPDAGGNTVFAGHVFTYDDPEGVFYHLGKIEVGDQVATYWNGTEYLYEVTEKKEVSATAIEIEAPSENSQLTLYTCTPLWNPVNRLVITAKLSKVTQP